MDTFVCPQCFLETRPRAMYSSLGKTWWSVSAEEASLYRNLCPHLDLRPNGTFLGCDSMRVPIDRWLSGDAAPASRYPFANGEKSIVDVAVATHAIETRADLAVAFPPAIGGIFRDDDDIAICRRNPGTVDVNSYALQDVLLAAPRLILFHDGERLSETRYYVDDHDYWITPPPPRETREIGAGETVVVGANLTFRNYYHWMMQCLPAIDQSLRMADAADCVLALPELSGWQERSLALLGLGQMKRIRIDFDCHYFFRRAHWCGYLSGLTDGFLSPAALRVLDRLACGIAPADDGPERIYVARADTRNRVIGNEPEVRQILEAHGFVTLVSGFLPLETQIGLFKNARVVVGGHGAGLTNLAFCQPGTVVLELLQAAYPALYMNRIAQAKGLRYHAESFADPVGGDVNRREWFVDLKQLEARLPGIL